MNFQLFLGLPNRFGKVYLKTVLLVTRNQRTGLSRDQKQKPIGVEGFHYEWLMELEWDTDKVEGG